MPRISYFSIAADRPILSFLFLLGILFFDVAVSTIERQCSREAAFFHAYGGPMLSQRRNGGVAAASSDGAPLVVGGPTVLELVFVWCY